MDPKRDPKKRRRLQNPTPDVEIYPVNTTGLATEMTGVLPTVGSLPLGADGPLDLFPDLTTDPEDD